MNACKGKLKKQMMTLKQQQKNVLLVAALEKKKSYGTDAQVVEFGCMRTIASGILDGYLCDIFFYGALAS
jgi:hypothetical protein